MNIDLMREVIEAWRSQVAVAIERRPEGKGEKYFTQSHITPPLAKEMGIVIPPQYEGPICMRVFWETDPIKPIRAVFDIDMTVLGTVVL